MNLKQLSALFLSILIVANVQLFAASANTQRHNPTDPKQEQINKTVRSFCKEGLLCVGTAVALGLANVYVNQLLVKRFGFSPVNHFWKTPAWDTALSAAFMALYYPLVSRCKMFSFAYGSIIPGGELFPVWCAHGLVRHWFQKKHNISFSAGLALGFAAAARGLASY